MFRDPVQKLTVQFWNMLEGLKLISRQNYALDAPCYDLLIYSKSLQFSLQFPRHLSPPVGLLNSASGHNGE